MKPIKRFQEFSYTIQKALYNFFEIDRRSLKHSTILNLFSIGSGYNNYIDLLSHQRDNKISIGPKGLKADAAINYLKIKGIENQKLKDYIPDLIREFWEFKSNSQTTAKRKKERIIFNHETFISTDNNNIIEYYGHDEYSDHIYLLHQSSKLSSTNVQEALEVLLQKFGISNKKPFTIIAPADFLFDSLIKIVSTHNGTIEFDDDIISATNSVAMFKEEEINSYKTVDEYHERNWYCYKLNESIKEKEPDECGPEYILFHNSNLSSENDILEYTSYVIIDEDELSISFRGDINEVVDFTIFSMNEMYDQIQLDIHYNPADIFFSLESNNKIRSMINSLEEKEFSVAFRNDFEGITLGGIWALTSEDDVEEGFYYKDLPKEAVTIIKKFINTIYSVTKLSYLK